MTTDRTRNDYRSHRTTLPQWNGRAVPWVTRWTGETSAQRYEVTMDPNGRLTYKDGNNHYDDRGVLWQREGISRNGEPEWAMVSTFRQKRSMEKRLCQVCGTKIADGPLRWLMPLNDEVIEELPNGDEITVQPPTCEECIPLALELCPHLKSRGYQILKVADYEVWGVTGPTVILGAGGTPQRVQAAVPFREEDDYTDGVIDKKLVLAQQIVVKLGKYVVEEAVPGTHADRPAPNNIEQVLRNEIRNALIAQGHPAEDVDANLDHLLAATQATFAQGPVHIPKFSDDRIAKEFAQYPQEGEGITYFRGQIDDDLYVDCLLAYEDNQLVGVLNHFPVAMGPERAGSVLLLVHPDHQRKGIGRALWAEAQTMWPVQAEGQNLTDDGKAFLEAVQ